ncbi:MAG: L,D-transpeptidase family protein [Planctomycetota bacterium]
MQTIKTAAIVVLMLTVLYGGYVSLTTPPEPLPEEVQEYLVIEESNGEGIAGPGLDLSEPPPMLADAAMTGNELAATELPMAPAIDPPTFGASFGDNTAPDATGTPASAASFNVPSASLSISDRSPTPTDSLTLPTAPTSSVAATPLPLPASVTPAIGGISAGENAPPNTGQAFTMPDPNVAAANFVPSSQPFVGNPIAGEDVSAADSPVPPTAENAASLPPPTKSPTGQLTNAFVTADAMYGKGQLKEALATLSVFYGTPNLSPLEREQLLSRLDPLAREVIYSKRHLLEQPHRVTTNETLPRIAERYNVPWELLANINQVDDPVTVLPGTELKVVRGPFRAEVNLATSELTLFLGDLYAGRFAVAIGNDPPPAPGTFSVQDKQPSHVYYNREGVPVPAGSPENPYGKAWFDLGGSVCIHGSPNTVRPSETGCISLAGDHAQDLYGILTQGSVVTIRR